MCGSSELDVYKRQILAIQMLALSDEKLAEAFAAYKEGLKKKIVKANEELTEVKFEYKTN